MTQKPTKIVSSVAATWRQVSTRNDIRYNCTVQNISTEPVTLLIAITTGGIQSVGTILNPAPAAGQAGGSITFGKINLKDLWILRTTTGNTISIISEDLDEEMEG